MKRLLRIVVFIGVSLWFCPVTAQTSALTVGARGGGTILDAGGGGAIDLRYAWYGDLSGGCQLGLAAGAGIGYGQIKYKGSEHWTYSRTDYLGNAIDYTIDADYEHKNRYASAEASLLAAFRISGFTMNVGPRFLLPFSRSAKLTISYADIVAYYPRYDVSIPNEEITGRLITPYEQSCATTMPKYHLLLALEAGWEFVLDSRSSLGLQAYTDIGLWSSKTTSDEGAPLIDVAPIEAVNTPAVVTVHSASVDPKRYIAVGVRVYYSFQLFSSRSRRINTGDSRGHYNRYYYY